LGLADADYDAAIIAVRDVPHPSAKSANLLTPPMRVGIEPAPGAVAGWALLSHHFLFAFLFQVSAIGQFAFDSFDDAFEFRFLGCSIFHKNESALAQGLKI
jgi:hypothetical protein